MIAACHRRSGAKPPPTPALLELCSPLHVATQQMQHARERVERVRQERLAPVCAQRVAVRDDRTTEERRIFARDDSCALGDRQRLFGIVSIDRECVREVVEGARIVGAVSQAGAVLRDGRFAVGVVVDQRQRDPSRDELRLCGDRRFECQHDVQVSILCLPWKQKN